ncbi:serine hydrolase domain-containing protein [Rufibacter roseus]|uniref:Serine hydrolase domain-containing protein n=1 Tax=Rufibacter roseus TaxID=1567108 RepID=A0ABW2DMR1_9BACT|nr:serine hydrolase domain-containing protein [Rufibacter roseus]
MRNTIKILPIIFFCSHFSFGQHVQLKRLDGRKITSVEIDSTILQLMDKADVTGLALTIINNNKIGYTKAYGFKNNTTKALLDTSTVLYGASFSKAVFAYLSLLLVQEGLLDLDKPLYQYLDKPLTQYENYMELSGDDRWKLITARMCLSHTTGFPNWRFLNAKTGEFDSDGKLAIYFTPGTRYAYSGEGFALLQLAIEKITGRGLDELAEEKVFKPLGMRRTSYVWQPHFENNYAMGHDETETLLGKKKRKKAGGAGSLETTVADYSRFIENIMQGNGLNRRTRKMMLTPQIQIHSKYQFPTITEETTSDNKAIKLSYGLGWGLLSSKFGKAFFKEGHDEGWQHYNINFIDKGISIIIMTNSSNGEKIFKEVLEQLIADTFTPWEWERYLPYNLK